MRPSLSALAFVILAGLAATGTAPAVAATVAAAGPISISGDSFAVDDASHSATFTGNVQVTAPGLKLSADAVTASYGTAGPSSIKTFVASGHVSIVTAQQTAHGDRASYDPSTHVLKLTGNVVVENGAGRITGGEMDVNLQTHVTSFAGGKGGRVTGVFTPQ